jgi:hypothetical protein
MYQVVSEIAQVALVSLLKFYLYLKNYMSLILFACDSNPCIEGEEVKLPLCLIKYYVMKTYRGVDVLVHHS